MPYLSALLPRGCITARSLDVLQFSDQTPRAQVQDLACSIIWAFYPLLALRVGWYDCILYLWRMLPRADALQSQPSYVSKLVSGDSCNVVRAHEPEILASDPPSVFTRVCSSRAAHHRTATVHSVSCEKSPSSPRSSRYRPLPALRVFDGLTASPTVSLS